MERPESFTALTILGAIMVITGITLFSRWYLQHWRRRRRDETPTNGVGTFLSANVFFHFGMLLLVLGGVGLIFFGAVR